MMRDKRTTRGPYVYQACGWCRLKRIRCTGERPICGTCETSGHASDCSWGPEPVRRINSKEYVKSLESRIERLVKYASLLEARLEQCRNEHGGLIEDYLHLRPNSPPLVNDRQDFDLNPSDNEDDLADRMREFHFEGQDLLHYGRTSIFQFAPTVPGNLSRFPEIAENSSRCYVLLVDGVDEINYNPDFDWSRHLPPEVFLDRREHDKLLDLLFKFFTSWCLRIVPPLFLRDMYRALSFPASQPPPKTAHYSPMLHNALLALATAFSDDPRIRDLKSRQYFARRAKSYIDIECSRPNISVMHALSILASFHSSLGDQSLGYLYFGMSGRVSQALGLGIDCTPWVKANFITNDDMLDRNWAHWTTFSQDVCWSLYVGREFCVSPPSDRKTIPIPFVDSEFDQMPWHHSPSGIPPQPNYLSRTFAATCELLRIGRHIMEVVNVLSNPGTRQEISHELISKFDVELNAWKENLPPEVEIKLSNRATATPHRIMLELAFWWLFILLHRPFYRRSRIVPGSESNIDHVKLCDRAARNIMELLNTWRTLYSLRYVPVTFIQVVFSAGTIFLLSAVRASSGTRVAKVSFSQSLSQANLCIQYLLESGRSFQCANYIAGILGNLLQGELKSRLQETTIIPSYADTTIPPETPYLAGTASIPQPSVPQPSTHHVWDPRKDTSVLPEHRESRPKAQGSPTNRAMQNKAVNGNIAGPSSSAGIPSIDMGFGMRGGEAMSMIHFEGDQLERQLGVFAEETPQEPLELTDEDFAALLEALNRQYPYGSMMEEI